MGKQFFAIIVSAILVLTAITALIQSTAAHADFNAYLGETIDDDKIDGNVSSEWDDAGKATGIAINPQKTADVWTKNDGVNLYIAIMFIADSNDPWVAIQLGGNSCMEAGTDAALFGNNDAQFNATGYKDCYLSGTGGAKADAVQNGIGAISLNAQNVTTIELKKPLNSGDKAGKDIDWMLNDNRSLVIIWDSNGRGSSGGTTNHYGNGLMVDKAIVRTVLINSSAAKPGDLILMNVDSIVIIIAVIVFVIAFATVALLLLRKRSPKPNP